MQSMILPLPSSHSSSLVHFANESDFLKLSFASSSTFSPSACCIHFQIWPAQVLHCKRGHSESTNRDRYCSLFTHKIRSIMPIKLASQVKSLCSRTTKEEWLQAGSHLTWLSHTDEQSRPTSDIATSPVSLRASVQTLDSLSDWHARRFSMWYTWASAFLHTLCARFQSFNHTDSTCYLFQQRPDTAKTWRQGS